MSGTRQRVLAEVELVAERFRSEGFPVFLVGGIVRDLELGAGIDELDFDLTTPARPAEIKAVIAPIAQAIWTQGERFGTIGCMISGREYEITTHRAEWYSDASRKPQVEFGDDIESDLSRRDFTVNAMALRLPDGQLVDPFAGLADLHRRRLVTPIAAEVSFADDPLRILRAARFIARHDLVPSADLERAAAALVDRLEIVSSERTRDELDKLLLAHRPSQGLAFLDRVDALPHLLPALPRDHLGAVGAALDRSEPDVQLRRLIVFASLPPRARTEQLARLRYSNEQRRTMRSILAAREEVAAMHEWSDEAVRRLVDSVGFGRIDLLFALARALDDDAEAELAFAALAQREDLSSLDPVLSGDEVMREMNLGEGPEVGAVLAALRDRRLRQGPASRADELEFLARFSARD